MAESISWKFASVSSGSLRFLSTNFSQGSVATRLQCGGTINYCFTGKNSTGKNRLAFGKVAGKSRVERFFRDTV